MTADDTGRLSPSQLYHRVLLDIATSAAIKACGVSIESHAASAGNDDTPGATRDRLLAGCDAETRRRVSALANSAVGALALQKPEQLAETALKHGIVLPAEEARQIAEHFEAKRNATLSYQRGRELS